MQYGHGMNKTNAPVICLLAVFIIVFLVMHAGAQYGLETDIPGEVRVRLVYSPSEGLVARGGARVTLRMTAGSEGDMRAVLGLDNTIVRTDPDLDGSFEDALASPPRSVAFRINSFRIEGYGALWANGPAVRLRIGQFYTNYSDWIARSIGRNGIELHGLPFGKHTLDVHYGLPAQWYALRLAGGTNEQFGRLVTLHRPIGLGDTYETDAHLYARLGSTRRSFSSIDLAVDGTNHVGGARFETVKRWGQDMWLGATLWAVDDHFDPPRARRNREGDTVAYSPGQVGAEIEAGHTIGSVTGGLRVQRYVTIDPPRHRGSETLFLTHARTVTYGLELSRDPHAQERSPYIIRVERTVPELESHQAIVVGLNENYVHWEARAQKMAMVGGQPVEFMAVVGGDDRQSIRAKVQAEWDAPNGLRMRVHYATHDSDAFALEPTEWHPSGLYITAYAHREF